MSTSNAVFANAPLQSIPAALARENSKVLFSKTPSDRLSTEVGNAGIPLQKKNRAARILIDATRDFGRLNRPSSIEIDHYKELFYQLIDRIPDTDKRLLSAMLARSPFAPRAVALYFAQDKEEIAAPFLLFSTVLGDLDLRAIAKKKGRAYAHIIAKRRLPMESFTLETLKKVDTLEQTGSAIKTTENTQLGKTDPSAVELNTPSESDEVEWLNGDEIVALAAVGGKLGKSKQKQEAKAESRRDMVALASRPDMNLPGRETRELIELARQLDHYAVAGKIEEICGLDSASTLRLIKASSGEEIIYLVKALGMTSPQDIKFVLLLCPRISRNMDLYSKTRKLLNDLDTGICRMIFNEIGAKFDITKPDFAPKAIEEPAGNFTRAVERRRSSLEQSLFSRTTRNAQNAQRASTQRYAG